MKNIQYSRSAIKTLTRMSTVNAQRIRGAIREYAVTGHGDVRRMQGVPTLRLRVGDWRVIFSEDGLVIMIIKIGSRGDVYKGV